MTTSFPTDKTQPFVAENGVTYYWDSDRWRVKTFKVDESILEEYATEEWVEEKIAEAELDGDIDLSAYATRTYSDSEDSKLQLQIDELGVTKGKVARYTCSSISGGFASRPGQLAFNSGDPTAVNQISFGTEDSDNILTKPMADGDIIEFVDAVSGKVSRYKITDASGAPTGVAVEYISGDNDFNVGEEEQVYIYPQNASGASKDYVDDALKTKVDISGDTMTGTLTIDNGSTFETSLEILKYESTAAGMRESTFKVGADGKITAGGLIKTTRSTGYAWQIKPDDGDAVTWFHTNGNFLFNGKGEINNDLDITTTSNGVRILGSLKVKADGGTISSSNNFEAFGNYAAYNGLITSDNHLVNKKYVDDKAGGGVEIYNGPNPPSGKARGTLLLSSNNALYIYM